MPASQQPVVVLGAGVNGCAVARELVLNGVDVWLVDTADIASGASAGSSHLIHGGLRYLEYGEFDLVRESLAERTRLLQLAPQFVRPLRLWIPTANRFGGTIGSVGHFFNWKWWPTPTPRHGRGLELVRAGLMLYDAYARDPSVPRYKISSVEAPGAPPFNRNKYRWLAAYYDGQVEFPERLVLALVTDARQIATERGLDFRVLTHHRAKLAGDTVEIEALPHSSTPGGGLTTTPAAIVNATGAWVDETLSRLQVPAGRLMGGTKGSHLFTFNARLREALAGQGVYAEASDGRPIFITPLADTVLIGTTDVRFECPPENARATEGELAYLLKAVNTILPEARLDESDINFHYSAVRPLPYVDAKTPAAITRRHSLVRNDASGVPLFSVVGGKLTTMRSLAQTTAAAVLTAIDRPICANSEQRPIPGADGYPRDAAAREATLERIAASIGLAKENVAAVWRLCGTRTESILRADDDRTLLNGTAIPCSFVRHAIEHEQGRSLPDLVERRLVLLYHQHLTRGCLTHLAHLLVDQRCLAGEEIAQTVQAEIERLAARYGKRVE